MGNGGATGAAPDGRRADTTDRIRPVVRAAQELDRGRLGVRHCCRPGFCAGVDQLVLPASRNPPGREVQNMKIDLLIVEEAAKELYIRALKVLPPDIKAGFQHLAAGESGSTARNILATMLTNIRVAEDTNTLLCQDTGLPIYNIRIGSCVEVDGQALKQAIRTGCERATREHPLRSSVVHPLTRKNEHTSCGIEVPVIHIDFTAAPDILSIEMVPKGSGSENNSFRKMGIHAEGR